MVKGTQGQSSSVKGVQYELWVVEGDQSSLGWLSVVKCSQVCSRLVNCGQEWSLQILGNRVKES